MYQALEVIIIQEGSDKTWIHVREIIPHAQAFAIFLKCPFVLEKRNNKRHNEKKEYEKKTSYFSCVQTLLFIKHENLISR